MTDIEGHLLAQGCGGEVTFDMDLLFPPSVPVWGLHTRFAHVV